MTRSDRVASQSARTSASWQQQRAYQQTLPSLAGLSSYTGHGYYHVGSPERTQTPAGHLAVTQTNPQFLNQPVNSGISPLPDRPATATGWSSVTSYGGTPAISPGRHYTDGSGGAAPSNSSSTASSPVYPQLEHQYISQSPSSYPPHRAAPRYGLNNTSYARVGAWAYEQREQSHAYNEENEEHRS
jgi:hypothetical protein